VAKNAQSWEGRKAAVKKLTSQAVLIDIAKNDADSRIREAAVRNVNFTDSASLAVIAEHDSDSDVRRAAEEKLTG
jgi:hypothetical protein